ncbi:SURF1 family cytochrome oxidase biogenesis protein, partial [Burkholderia sp. SIMBA_024]|uniref:SURF1 family cytochrome oxidase biogenesis protein n=1 Tax=Burkholderia sp. SIMBA_024 TaxID=3085768 RepID=UPI0039797624
VEPQPVDERLADAVGAAALDVWGVYVLVAIGFAVACAFLSNWQFERNESRSEQIALIERNYDADPVPLADLIGDDGVLEPGDQWHPVILQGE